VRRMSSPVPILDSRDDGSSGIKSPKSLGM
jgi:hypothetical protein